jgi:hypothetical protein
MADPRPSQLSPARTCTASPPASTSTPTPHLPETAARSLASNAHKATVRGDGPPWTPPGRRLTQHHRRTLAFPLEPRTNATSVTSPAVLDALAPREFPTNGICGPTASAPASHQPNLHPSPSPPAGGPSQPPNDSHARRQVPASSRHSTIGRSFGTRMGTAACGARSRPTRTQSPRNRHHGTPHEGRSERRRHPTNRPPTTPLTWRGDQNSVPLAHRHPQTRKPPTGSGMPDSPCAPAEGVQRRRSAVARVP